MVRSRCQHRGETHYALQECSHGRRLIVEVCDLCRGNARGPGQFVSVRELLRAGLTPDELPPYYVRASDDPDAPVRQPGLFDGQD